MGVLIVDVEMEVEKKFRKVVEKRFGPGDHVVEGVVNTLVKKWVEAQADVKS
jgi:hypothetical protein